jgi:autotransporter-associated beta strand protein
VAGALPPDSELKVGVSYSQSGTFNLNGYDQTVGQLYSGVITNTGSRIVTTTAPATLTVNQSVGTTYDGRLTGELRLVKAGAGTLSLSGTNNTQDAQVVVRGAH